MERTRGGGDTICGQREQNAETVSFGLRSQESVLLPRNSEPARGVKTPPSKAGSGDQSWWRPDFLSGIYAMIPRLASLECPIAAHGRPCSRKLKRGGASAGEGGHFTPRGGFRPLYIRRQLGLRATLRRSSPTASCAKRPKGHKAGVSGWSPLSDSSAIPSKLAPRREVRIRKADCV